MASSIYCLRLWADKLKLQTMDGDSAELHFGSSVDIATILWNDDTIPSLVNDVRKFHELCCRGGIPAALKAEGKSNFFLRYAFAWLMLNLCRISWAALNLKWIINAHLHEIRLRPSKHLCKGDTMPGILERAALSQSSKVKFNAEIAWSNIQSHTHLSSRMVSTLKAASHRCVKQFELLGTMSQLISPFESPDVIHAALKWTTWGSHYLH